MQALSGVITAWASLYADSAVTRTLVAFAHVAALVGGGGLAVVADRATLRAARESFAEQQGHLEELDASHRIVLAGLVIVSVSGLLLLGADLDTYLHSRTFWIKMGGFVLLLVNGAYMLWTSRQVRAGHTRAWSAMRRSAMVSLILWFFVTLCGVALPNVS
jgi:uncharacterized membrane protein